MPPRTDSLPLPAAATIAGAVKAQLKPFLPLLKIMMEVFRECSVSIDSGTIIRTDSEDLRDKKDERGAQMLAPGYRVAPPDFIAFSLPTHRYEPEDGMAAWGYMKLVIDCAATPVRAVKIFELRDPMAEREVLLFPGQQALVVQRVTEHSMRKLEPDRTWFGKGDKAVLEVRLTVEPCTAGPTCVHPPDDEEDEPPPLPAKTTGPYSAKKKV